MGTFLLVLLALALFYGATKLVLDAINRHFSKLSYEREEGHLYYGVLQSLLAMGLCSIGIALLAVKLSTGQVVVFVLGLLALGGAFLSWKRYKGSKKGGLRFLALAIGLGIAGLLLVRAAF